jgi:tetratricopeptide (TPR) repeat protein
MDRPTLERTLDSIAAQTWPSLEIVVAAACGHGHRALPEEHGGRRLRLVRGALDERLPRPIAANLCLESAEGEWFNFLDDDDEFLPEHIEKLLTAPRPNGERVVYSRTRVVDQSGATIGHCGFAGFHAQLYYQSRSTPAGTLFHRSLVDEGARFDPAFDLLEDHEFFVNLASRTEFLFVDAVTGIWHAQAGESGAGFGHNYSPERLEPFYEKMRSKWNDAFERWNSGLGSLLFLGQHNLRSGNSRLALAYLERAVAIAPRDVNALNLCGMANYYEGNLDRAKALLESAIARSPGHKNLVANLNLVLASKGVTS